MFLVLLSTIAIVSFSQQNGALVDATSATATEKCDDNGSSSSFSVDDQATSSYQAPAPYKAFETSQHKSSFNDNHDHFGRLLDAGTGSESLRWLASLFDKSMIESFTAITADESMHNRVVAQADELGISDKGQIIIGNWIDGVNKNTGRLNFNSRRRKKKDNRV